MVMKKPVVIKSVTLIALIYLGIQFLVLPAYLERQEKDKQVLPKLLKLCSALHIPMFLIEPEILSKYDESTDLYSEMKKMELLRFGVMTYDRIEYLKRLRMHYETIGFKFFSTKSYHQQLKASVTSHLFLCNPNLTVHIVVFFNRTSDSIWHGDVEWNEELEKHCKADRKYFFQHSGILKKFTIMMRNHIMVPSQAVDLAAAIPDSKLIECNLTRADEFFTKHPPEDLEESKKFQRNARQIVARAKQHLDDLGIPFWLSSGTCLGWYRQCSIIPYSQDVDLGINIKHFKPELVATFERGGFFLKNVFGKVTDSYELSFQAGDIKVDLFFFYEEDDHIWNGGTHHETGQKYKYTFPKFNLCWTVFLELTVRIPCPTEPYIEANYGKNWMTPVKEWDWNKSPPNVQENGIWPKEEWSDVIQVF